MIGLWRRLASIFHSCAGAPVILLALCFQSASSVSDSHRGRVVGNSSLCRIFTPELGWVKAGGHWLRIHLKAARVWLI